MPKVKSLPRGVAMVGAGMSKFGAFAEKNSRDLFVESYKAMTKSVDKGFDPSIIEAMYVGNFSSDQFEHQAHLAPILADSVGLLPIPATRV
jgi:acetyl-CoA C-acetyltransferase